MKFYELKRGTLFYRGTNRARIYERVTTFRDDDGNERNAAQVYPLPTKYVTVGRDEAVTPANEAQR